MSTSTTPAVPSGLVIALLTFILFVRVLVGYQKHSGEENYHGSKVAYGGDYEAQRHWMELTLHLSVGEWYWYDLDYWGLDYPPLTAYVSWLCGVLSSLFVGPESVALYSSRGYEDPVHKAYMRATVVFLDLTIYISAVWIITRALERNRKKFFWTLALALLQPALILIDHGHFQYNSVSLGLSLWACYFMTKSSGSFFATCGVGSVFFCLALNFKQMCLYYAPVVFFYLLGRCLEDRRQFITRFCTLGLTVMAAFAVLWFPFVLHGGPEDSTAFDRVVHVLHRIFPFQRGLFEGKVSNLWCALSVKPFSIRSRIAEHQQPIVALVMTAYLIVPACIKLFQVGQSSKVVRNENSDRRLFLWGMTSTGLAFFLASFQVHEKSILIPLAPASLLLSDDFMFVQWFSLACAWTLWPLLCTDRLETAYFCTCVIFLSLTWLCLEDKKLFESEISLVPFSTAMQSILALSSMLMLTLHGLEVAVPAPSSLPDLYPVLWSITGCGIFSLSWLVTCRMLFTTNTNKLKQS